MNDSGNRVSAFSGLECWTGVLEWSTGMESLEWTHWNGEYWTGFHLGILSWREAHGSRGRKAMARGG